MNNSYIEGLQFQLPHPFRADAERLRIQFDTDTYKDAGVVRWRSNGVVPPQEVLDFWKHIGKRFNMAKSVAARSRETKEFLKSYRENQKPSTGEQLVEMRGAFNKGTAVVDVISGRKILL